MTRLLAPAAVMLAAAAAWMLALPSAAVDQPIAFAHAKHSGVGCAVCHRGVATAAKAGIPDQAFCAKCHATAPRGAEPFWGAKATPIAWVQINRLPEHVMFSHRRHVAIAKLDCASCHGDMASRQTPVARPAARLEMTTCLSCHRHEGAAEDCAACHR